MNLIEVIDSERPSIYSYMSVNDFSDALERISEAASNPRVMKRWADDCKPINPGLYYVCKDGGFVFIDELSEKNIVEGCEFRFSPMADSDVNTGQYTHWLELEPTPVLPEERA